MRHFIFFLACSLLFATAPAQGLFTSTLGNTDNDYANAMTLTSDGGMVIVGKCSGMPYPKINLLVKLNTDGDTVWTRTLNYLLNEEAFGIKELADGNLLVIGEGKYCVNGNCGTDGFAVKLNPIGEVLWSKGYGEQLWDRFTDVVELPNGNLMFCGETASIGAGNYDMFILQTDANGDTLWHRAYGGPGQDYCGGILATPDGGFLVAGGYRATAPTDPSWPILIRTDASGNQLWAKTYDIGSYSQFTDVIALSDGYLGLLERGLIKTDFNGNLVWYKRYIGFESHVAQNTYAKLRPAATGGYLISGRYDHSGEKDACVMLVDGQGEPYWFKYFGGTGAIDYFCDAVQLPDGRIAACGGTVSYGQGLEDALVVMMDPYAVAGNCATLENFATSTFTTTVAAATPLESQGLWYANAGFVTRRVGMPGSTVCQTAVGTDPLIADGQLRAWKDGNSLRLEVPSTWQDTQVEIRLHDLSGRLLLEQRLQTQSTSTHLQIPRLPHGIYVIQATNGQTAIALKIRL